MTVPRINRTNGVSTDGRSRGWERRGRTVEHRADENSGQIGLLVIVYMVWDLWSIGIIGPRLLLRVIHGPDACEEEFWSGSWVESERRGFREGEETLELDGVTGCSKSSGKVD